MQYSHLAVNTMTPSLFHVTVGFSKLETNELNAWKEDWSAFEKGLKFGGKYSGYSESRNAMLPEFFKKN